ncbi:hypothetical protein FGO68_gene10166 [Halteria grandinella]|uniref:RING-type domain-containing protein n=1 Tax=Halteria grandinella TaxID=5974 RepID=A0A8J8T370_HALGN|nr:hypothetical protein FGO68_gene10166 [Halteria grandinella]
MSIKQTSLQNSSAAREVPSYLHRQQYGERQDSISKIQRQTSFKGSSPVSTHLNKVNPNKSKYGQFLPVKKDLGKQYTSVYRSPSPRDNYLERSSLKPTLQSPKEEFKVINSTFEEVFMQKSRSKAASSRLQSYIDQSRPIPSYRDVMPEQKPQKIVMVNSNGPNYKSMPESKTQQLQTKIQSKAVLKDTCEICMDEIDDDEYKLIDCKHNYHKQCLKSMLQNYVNQKKNPIVCAKVGCKQEISMKDMSILLTKMELADYSEYKTKALLEQYTDLEYCPLPDCGYPFVTDTSQGVNKYRCQKCNKYICVDCKAEFHNGIECKEYQERLRPAREKEAEALFLKAAEQMGLKNCPFCKIPVEKISGCDHIKCKCGKEFCYKCGGVYKQCQCYKNQQDRINNLVRAYRETQNQQAQPVEANVQIEQPIRRRQSQRSPRAQRLQQQQDNQPSRQQGQQSQPSMQQQPENERKVRKCNYCPDCTIF